MVQLLVNIDRRFTRLALAVARWLRSIIGAGVFQGSVVSLVIGMCSSYVAKPRLSIDAFVVGGLALDCGVSLEVAE